MPARDAVQVPLDVAVLQSELEAAGLLVVCLSSAATDRETYLRQPDLGRRLDDDSRTRLQQLRPNAGCDLVVIVSDGLSAPATQRHAGPLIVRLTSRLLSSGWQLAPVVVVGQARVALEDEIGELLAAKLSLILLGERPGLGSPDSLGAYLVYQPRIGHTDAERNCVSNIRPGGLSIEDAAETLLYLLTAARTRRLSGVALKDERGLLPDHRPV